jgi:hypothetical protein
MHWAARVAEVKGGISVENQDKLTKTTKGIRQAGQRYVVNLSAPWEDNPKSCFIGSGFQFKSIEQFLIERTKLHEIYIREEARTKRLSLMLSALLFLAACLVIIFAPESRQTISHWIGAAMFVVAAGVAGYKRVWGKSKILTISADQGSIESAPQ